MAVEWVEVAVLDHQEALNPGRQLALVLVLVLRPNGIPQGSEGVALAGSVFAPTPSLEMSMSNHDVAAIHTGIRIRRIEVRAVFGAV